MQQVIEIKDLQAGDIVLDEGKFVEVVKVVANDNDATVLVENSDEDQYEVASPADALVTVLRN